MNFGIIQALTRLALPTGMEARFGVIPTMINEALNQLQLRRSWNCMKATITFTLPATGPGPFTYALPSTYKEQQSGVNCLRAYTLAPFGNSIWRVFTRQEVQRLRQIGVNVAERTAFLEQDVNGIWTIYFPGPLDEGTLPPDTNFEFDIYQMLPAVSALTDENDLMRKYPMLVLEMTKYLIFSIGSDEDSTNAKNEALRMINGDPSQGMVGYFTQASLDDNSRNVRGRTSRFGGF